MTSATRLFDAGAILADGGADPTRPFIHEQALQQLTQALDEQARLTPAGGQAVRGALVGAVRTHLAVQRLAEAQPELATVEIARPVFLTGLLRSGTTLVHNLLAQHPGFQVPALWELTNPAATRGDAASYERLADAAQEYVEEYYRVAPDLPKIHFLDARRPDECHRLTSVAFESMVYEMRYRVPSYGAWLAGRDGDAAFRYHRWLLQAILWRRDGTGPVALKCPFHLWRLDALVRSYPDARIVLMHRNPTETVPSTCSLCVTVRGARSNQIDRYEIGQQWLERIGAAIDDLDRQRATIPAHQILDVRYRDLITDPIACLARICEFAGVSLSTLAAERMRTYLADNTQTKHGVHRYEPADFGLSAAGLDRRFAGYRQRYRL